MVMNLSILVSICLLFYKFYKLTISLFCNDENENENDNEKKENNFFCRVNFLLLLEYLFTLLFVIIFHNSSEDLHNSFKNNTFYYLLWFGFPISISYTPFLIKRSHDNEDVVEICCFIFSDIMHVPTMIIFYLFLYCYINTIYLLTSFVTIIAIFEIYFFLYRQSTRKWFSIIVFIIIIIIQSIIFHFIL